jgi:hypothetical protein
MVVQQQATAQEVDDQEGPVHITRCVVDQRREGGPPRAETPVDSRPKPTSLGGWVLFGSGVLTCPCDLPVSLGILAALLAGTALGAFLAQNLVLVGLAVAVYSVVALVLSWRKVSRSHGWSLFGAGEG